MDRRVSEKLQQRLIRPVNVYAEPIGGGLFALAAAELEHHIRPEILVGAEEIRTESGLHA